jgi:hypothetical protein
MDHPPRTRRGPPTADPAWPPTHRASTSLVAMTTPIRTLPSGARAHMRACVRARAGSSVRTCACVFKCTCACVLTCTCACVLPCTRARVREGRSARQRLVEPGLPWGHARNGNRCSSAPHACARTSVHWSTRARAMKRTHTHARTHTRAHSHTHTHSHAHAHAHTHT